MIPVLLTRVKTRDGVSLDGIYVKPAHRSNTALIWVHGLGSRFSSGQTLTKEVSSAASKSGVGYFNFNNRGHDTVNRDGIGKKRNLGRAFERFEDCVHDIRAVIREARRLGFKNIVLAGHSTGANKILYYLHKTKDRSVKGLLLLAGLSDISAVAKEIGLRELRRRVKIVEKLARKNPTALVPEKFGLYSHARYLSLFQPGRNEDTFPYYNPMAEWKALKSIRIPVAVVIGAKDQYLDRPAKNLIEIFQKNAIRTKSFSGVIIKGANHGFYKKEKELAKVIADWIRKI
jgi:alpha-beta hydrolase superfamily lysophospholipase